VEDRVASSLAEAPFKNLEEAFQRWLDALVHFALLGPLEVVEGGRPLSLGGPKQRALLAMLLLHANEVVSRDRLVEAIWGEQLPVSPTQALDTYVSRLRKLLGADRVARRVGGYALRVEPGELDLDRFELLVEKAAFREALAIWRGPALADLLFEPFAAVEAQRLDERRLWALEERIESEISAGEGPQLVSELERLVGKHPLRERLLGQLMLALYRAGRQTAALEAYRAARRRLAEQLGLEPSPQLQELERRILSHDPTLGGRPRVPGLARPRRRSVVVLAVAVAAVALGTAAGVVLGTRGRSAAVAGSARVSRLLAIEVRSGRVLHAAELPGAAAAIAASGSLWLAVPSDQAVLRADPDSGRVVDRIAIPGQPGSVVDGAGAVWVASTLNGTIARVDPRTGTVVQTIRLGQQHTSAIAFGHGSLWVADTTDNAVIELDASTGSARRTLTLGVRPTSLAVGAQAIWVADHDAGSVSEVDLRSGQTVATIHVGNGPAALMLGAGALWVANSLDSTVSRIDPETGAVVATIPVGSGPSALGVNDGSVWVSNQYSGTVSRIDSRRNAVSRTVRFGGRPTALTVAAGTVWVSAGPSAEGHRGGTLILASSTQPGSIDPAIYSQAATAQFTGLAYDTLVTFAKTSGPDGLRLVPDLAVQVPAPTAGGTTYSFRLRPGIRYSDGRPVRASDFRRAFERLFDVGSPGLDDYTAITGADACRRHPDRCDLSGGVLTNDRAGTVAFQLSKPDPDFLFRLTDFGFSAPVPPGTPQRDAGYRAIPGTGPYRIARANKEEIRFVRNPFFREWSHAAQPAANPDQIVWTFSSSHEQTIRWVTSGRADWTWDLISPTELRTIRIRSPSQLHSNPIFAVEFFPLNTRLSPFDDRRVRQALNFAVDRRKVAQMYGGSSVAAPTCQPLVPGLIGYRRYCPYTLHPTKDGAYHGPDLARARRLVAESGTRGERIDVWGATDEIVIPRQVTAYVGSVLRSLGYRVHVHLARLGSITTAMRRRHQMSTDGDWLPAYPAPSSYMLPFFSCGGGHGNDYVCNLALDAEMARALSFQLRDPRKASALWTRVDREITDQAYWVPTVTDRFIDLVSKRIRNYEFNPVWGFIADQAWLR
jgi:YVTN family beta-propeller protein